MAMTKKEQAAMEAAINRAETLAALRWTAPVQRDVDVPMNGYSEGWDYNSYSQIVFRGWSSSMGEVIATTDNTDNTNGITNGIR